MNRNIVARIVVGLVLVGLLVCSSGCASSWAKGEGSLLEFHTYVAKAPMSHQWGMNPLLKDRVGPADAVAKQPIVNPNPKVVSQTDSSRREARD